MKSITDYFISIVVPIMNEEGNISSLIERISMVICNEKKYEIIFVDDGSTDKTLEVIKQFHRSDPRIKYLSFSRNFGHQNALRAGLDFAKGDCIISMDGDLQHPPELIPQMIKKWQEGYDIVYTLRKNNEEISYFKRKTSVLFYYLMNRLSHVEIEQGSADFRLIDRRVVDVIRSFQENPIFYRGMIRWLGFRQYALEYIPEKRVWGKTKYSFLKMFKFAMIGITSFSIRPLHISTILGLIIAVVSILYGIYAIFMKLFTSYTIQGWTSLLIVVAFIGGIQLLMIGILGEYLGKLFIEQKRRPPYIIKESTEKLNS
ncbi:MAG: glycosyltransferase family 2 protein [Bacteroidales bacterium]|nr:glycosyltransferase family 2 protein [Bacteroidales bacterium]